MAKAPANKKVTNKNSNRIHMSANATSRDLRKGNGPLGRAIKRAAGKKTYKTGGEF